MKTRNMLKPVLAGFLTAALLGSTLVFAQQSSDNYTGSENQYQYQDQTNPYHYDDYRNRGQVTVETLTVNSSINPNSNGQTAGMFRVRNQSNSSVRVDSLEFVMNNPCGSGFIRSAYLTSQGSRVGQVSSVGGTVYRVSGIDRSISANSSRQFEIKVDTGRCGIGQDNNYNNNYQNDYRIPGIQLSTTLTQLSLRHSDSVRGLPLFFLVPINVNFPTPPLPPFPPHGGCPARINTPTYDLRAPESLTLTQASGERVNLTWFNPSLSGAACAVIFRGTDRFADSAAEGNPIALIPVSRLDRAGSYTDTPPRPGSYKYTVFLIDWKGRYTTPPLTKSILVTRQQSHGHYDYDHYDRGYTNQEPGYNRNQMYNNYDSGQNTSYGRSP